MSLDEAIKVYNEFISSEEMKKFKEAEHMIMDEIDSQKPLEEYYKSSKLYDYYIQLPYNEVILTSDGAIFRHNGYNGIAKQKGNTSYHYCKNLCLSLCHESKEDIENWLDRWIREDNFLEDTI